MTHKCCIDECVRKVLEGNGARPYRHGAAAARRAQRKPEHARPPPQPARKTTFHLPVLRFNLLRRRGCAKVAGFSAASPRARKSHTFHREKGLFGKVRLKKRKSHQRRSESARKHKRKHSFGADRRSPCDSWYLIYLSPFTTALTLPTNASPARRCDFQRRGPGNNPGDRFFLRFLKISEQARLRACCRPPSHPPDPIDGCPQKTSASACGFSDKHPP